MVVELTSPDIKILIGLVTEEIDRIAEARKRNGFYDLGVFYYLVDIRNRLLVMPVNEELPSIISDREWQELLNGGIAR